VQRDPFHQRPWAELLFYLAASALVCVLAGWRFFNAGDGLDLAASAFGAVAAILVGVVIRRKRSADQSAASQDGNG